MELLDLDRESKPADASGEFVIGGDLPVVRLRVRHDAAPRSWRVGRAP